MTNYVLIYTGGGMPESEEMSKKVMAEWGVWYGKMGESIVDPGNPFGPSKNLGSDGSVSDGAVGAPAATGYTVISADSLDGATTAAADHPHLNYGGQISVHETFDIPM
jgi:hypothetical protein